MVAAGVPEAPEVADSRFGEEWWLRCSFSDLGKREDRSLSRVSK